jgi:RNA polymerase sigma-70 factor, ECF subfamily
MVAPWPVRFPVRAKEFSMPELRAELESLFSEYRPRLSAWLERRIPASLRPRLDPEDVLQEAFLTALRTGSVGVGTSAKAWIYTLVHDCYLELWERHTRDCRDHQRDEPWPDHSSIQQELARLTSATTPSEVAVRAEECQRVLEVVQALSAEDKQILELRWWEDLSHGDSAAMLHITEEAARQRYFRAFKRFSRLWQQREQCNGTIP